MRKPLTQALKWYEQSKILKEQEKELKAVTKNKLVMGKKIVEIVVSRAKGLKLGD
jgi:hypothetical protein